MGPSKQNKPEEKAADQEVRVGMNPINFWGVSGWWWQVPKTAVAHRATERTE